MGDRELLEFAARAAGITGWQSKHGYWNMKDFNCDDVVCCNDWPNYDPGTGEKLNPVFADAIEELRWNPLTDDGDALRLAVKLRLEFEWWKNGIAVSRDDLPPGAIQHVEDDQYAATRRAIVRAAAAIGKAMP